LAAALIEAQTGPAPRTTFSALLAAHEEIPQEALEGRLVCGEMGLDDSVRPVRGGTLDRRPR
jgi:predicted ATPase with chaperone activity